MSDKNFLIIMYGKNESINIDNAIFMSSLKRQFVYVDSCSTDGTQKLLSNKKINFIVHNYINWPTLRKVGYEYAKKNKFEWILMLDADEVISEKTLNYLDNLDKVNFDSYSLNFKTIFNGKYLNYLSHRPRIRFYSVDRTSPKGDTVLDFIDSRRNKHLSKDFYILNKDKTDFINLVNKQVQKVKYSSLEKYLKVSEHGIIKKIVFRFIHKKLILKSILHFLYFYIFKLGFLDGKAGLYYCFNYSFIFHFLMSSKEAK